MKPDLTYVAVWPIIDRSRPVGALIAEASRDLDVMVELAGGRIPARTKPRWDVSLNFDALVCQVPARLYTSEGEPSGVVTPQIQAVIQRMAINGHPLEEIAEKVGVSRSTVGRHTRQFRGSGRA